MGGRSSSVSAPVQNTTTTVIDRRLGAGDNGIVVAEGSIFEATTNVMRVDADVVTAALQETLGFAGQVADGNLSITQEVIDLARNTTGEAFDLIEREGQGGRELVQSGLDQAFEFAAGESAGSRSLVEIALETSAETFEQALEEVGNSREFAQQALGFAENINQAAFDFQSTVGELGGLKSLLNSTVVLGGIAAVAFIMMRRAR